MQTRRMRRLMRIHHQFISRRLFRHPRIMIHHPLAVVMFSARNDAANIPGFDRINSFVNHILVRIRHSALIIRHGTRSLMMHNQAQTFGASIGRQTINVIIWIRAHKIENVLFPIPKPILPTLIPTLYEHAVKTMFGSKINIAFHIRRIRTMFSSRQRPIRLPNMHLPPHTHKLLRLNPRNIRQ